MAETSTKPYLLRALYEWCCDNGYTPYLAVVVDRRTLVPPQHVKNGEIVLNVSPMATNQMAMGNELIEFQARFSGVAQQISIPVDNVSAIFAKETGHGMAFEVARPAPTGEDATAAGATAVGGEGDDPHAADAPPEQAEAAHVPVPDAGKDAPEGTAAASPAPRRRAAKGEGGADVIAFASSGSGRRKRDAAAKVEPQEPPGGRDEPPPAGGEGGGKGGKTRLTRVK